MLVCSPAHGAVVKLLTIVHSSVSSSNISGLEIQSDIPAILGRKPTKFGSFVAQYLKPMLE